MILLVLSSLPRASLEDRPVGAHSLGGCVDTRTMLKRREVTMLYTWPRRL